jgi:hypothetical protein
MTGGSDADSGSRLGSGRTEAGLVREMVFDILSNRRRRFVIHCLREADGPVSIRELSETIATWENDCDRATLEPKQRKRVYTALHQTHLPKMVQAGVAVYDSDEGIVELTPRSSVLETYLDLGTGRHDDRDDRPYVAVAVLVGLVGAALAFELPMLAAIPAWVYLLGCAALVLGVWAARTVEFGAASGEVRQPTSATDGAPQDD